MYTEILKIAVQMDEKEQMLLLSKAACLLREGHLVAFPTETVYGLGANALDARAVAQIFVVKGRPSDNPLIVHVAEIDDIMKIAELDAVARKVAESFFPGPLTLILPKKNCIPDLVTAGLSTVAVRIPAHSVARSLIKASGLPIAAPSANKSGRPSPTRAAHVQADFTGQIPLIIDSGAVEIGVESTVLDLSGKKSLILRPGKIGAKELAPLLGPVAYAQDMTEKPASPGMKYAHYAPQAQVILAHRQELPVLWRKEKEKGHDPLVLCFAGSADSLPQEAKSLILADEGDLEGYAHELFAAFRLGDVLGYSCLLAETVAQESGLGVAIMNRLQKAAYKKK